MSVINDTWSFLLRRKLWPAVLLLIGALVALPTVLAKEPDAPAPAAVSVKGQRDSALATQPIVALAGEGDRAGRRRVLGSRKNPFEPLATPTPTPKPKTPATPGATTAPDTGGGSPSAGSQPPAAVTPPVAGAPAQPRKRYEMFELAARFGSSEGDLVKQDLKRLEALPSAEDPVLIYLGVLSDKKTAVFLVDAGVVPQGDGTCKPSRDNCETIQLQAGETEFFDVLSEDGESTTAQYQLDLVKIRRKATSSAKSAKRGYARVSKAGRKIVRARITGDGPLRYRYSAKNGRLHKLSRKAYKAEVANAAKASRRAAKASRNRAEGHS